MALTYAEGMPLVDISLAQVITYVQPAGTVVDKTINFVTANEADVEPAISAGDEKIFRVKNQIIAINRTEDIVIGYDVTLKNNELIMELLALVDGGDLVFDEIETTKVIGYDAPSTGGVVEREAFDLALYCAEKDQSGDTVGYVKFLFKHTKGSPVKYTFKDGEFFVPEMKVSSRPKSTDFPVEISVLTALPTT